MSDAIFLAEYDGLIREVLETDGEFRLYPRGTSMLPLLRQGVDSVALRRLSRPPRKYDIQFYQRPDGSYILHRVKKVTPAGMIMWGDNQHMLERGVQEQQIIGYAARIFRGEKEVDFGSVAYRAYLWLWQFWLLRRVALPLFYRIRRMRNHAGTGNNQI